MNNGSIYFIQILFVAGITTGSQLLSSEDKQRWFNVARYAVYVLTIHAVPAICRALLAVRAGQPAAALCLAAAEAASKPAVVYIAAAGVLLAAGQSLYDPDFVFLYLGYLLVQYPDMASGGGESASGAPGAPNAKTDAKKSISYGVGMACSYFEGYLVHIIPSDGAKFVGFEENMRALEDKEGVLFPVKKMFIVITKSLYSPPDLAQLNRGSDQPTLEAFNSLEDVMKSVAGVRNRIYRNTAYKINRPAPPAPLTPPDAPAPTPPTPPPVCLVAECATPLHTLERVLNNRVLYDQLADISVAEVVEEFCSTLRSILEASPSCRGKCELVFYDHEDPTQNLAQMLLDRISQIDPKFEEKIIARREQNRNLVDDIQKLDVN